jgi:hypothetical protein
LNFPFPSLLFQTTTTLFLALHAPGISSVLLVPSFPRPLFHLTPRISFDPFNPLTPNHFCHSALLLLFFYLLPFSFFFFPCPSVYSKRYCYVTVDFSMAASQNGVYRTQQHVSYNDLSNQRFYIFLSCSGAKGMIIKTKSVLWHTCFRIHR